LLKASWLPKLKKDKSNSKTQWTTSAGTFETKYKAEAQVIFTEQDETRKITCEVPLPLI
jgi:hypothetical protein